jgi:hypothetical protein
MRSLVIRLGNLEAANELQVLPVYIEANALARHHALQLMRSNPALLQGLGATIYRPVESLRCMRSRQLLNGKSHHGQLVGGGARSPEAPVLFRDSPGNHFPLHRS